MQKIVPHLWFDKEAYEAANFYISLFEDSKIKEKVLLKDTPSGEADLLTIELAGQEFMLLSGGPYFKFNPSVSFLIACHSEEEVIALWDKFMEKGKALMDLGDYPFIGKYGWVMDQYGLSWQIMNTGEFDIKQKFTPTVMFVGDQCGNCEEAITFYTSIFKDSSVGDILRYGDHHPPNRSGTVQHASFTLENQDFAAMDSAYDHNYSFNEAISFIINCHTQEEIDYYWEKLSAVPEAEQCGWLKDKYGFSWQVVPTMMSEMMMTKDPKKLAQVTEVFLKMKKFDIAELIRVYEG